MNRVTLLIMKYIARTLRTMELRGELLEIYLKSKLKVPSFVLCWLDGSIMMPYALILRIEYTNICVEKIHELVEYGLIWTDERAFLLQPLGKVFFC